ncbi:MAG: PEGA domain-containing protein [Planctomycetes bacterium]|nr:PEGA domain-containing protein [Planctomycetota bacterium]
MARKPSRGDASLTCCGRCPGSKGAARPSRACLRLAGLAFSALLLIAGCVERRLTIRSDPPGALVIMSGGKLGSDADEHELGFTPVSTNFVYHGTRKITLIKDGYETLTVDERLNARWWDFFPLEFVTENLIPGRIKDHRERHYRLMPQPPMTATEPLLRRAEGFRAQQEAGTPF